MAVSFFPHNPCKDKSNIDIIVSFKAKRYKRSTGIIVPLDHWASNAQRCSESLDRFPQGIDYNKVLRRQKEAAEKAMTHFIGEFEAPSKEQFWEKVDEFTHGEKVSIGGFTAYFEDYVRRREAMRASSTAKTYRALLRKIEDYQDYVGRVFMFKDINRDFYDGFRHYLFSQTHGKDERQYSNNYFGRIIKVVKVVFNDARYNGVHRFDPLVNFKADDYVADTVYLSPEELNAMWG